MKKIFTAKYITYFMFLLVFSVPVFAKLPNPVLIDSCSNPGDTKSCPVISCITVNGHQCVRTKRICASVRLMAFLEMVLGANALIRQAADLRKPKAVAKQVIIKQDTALSNPKQYLVILLL